MTPEGHAALIVELKHLKAERPKISEEIGTAAQHGDLKENAEYHAAREKQSHAEGRILDIEDQLAAGTRPGWRPATRSPPSCRP